MNIWHDLSPSRVTPKKFTAVIEIPRGSKKKYELDKETGLIVLDRILSVSMHYPADYGFIPRTLGDDNDPLDILLLCSEVMDPLVLVECYPIGVINMVDGGENDEKILCVPYGDPIYNKVQELSDVPAHWLEEMKHFFASYKQLEKKEMVVGEIEGRAAAEALIARYIKQYEDKYGKK